MTFSGKAPDYPIMQILELATDVHPYFIGTQAHPELISRPLRPEPLFLGLVRAAIARRALRQASVSDPKARLEAAAQRT